MKICATNPMKYHLYTNNDWSTTDEFLTYVGAVDATEESRIKTIVSWFLNRILNSRSVPYFIEVSIEEYFKKEVDISINDAYVNEMAMTEYHGLIRRIMASPRMMRTFYGRWTEEETEPLVVVAESDISASFIFSKFPPTEYFL
jgi:hypothetical protein